MLVTVFGKAALPSDPALGEQAHVEQQRLVDGDLVALLVDEVEPLAGLVEDRAEIGADRGDERFVWPIACASVSRSAVSSAKKPCAEIASTPSGPTTSGSTNDEAE